MALIDRVRVSRRYQRAIRIDTDLGDPAALEGFVCPRSSAEILENMARHVSETGQGAFTWTGPYGSGKSSLAVALSASLGENGALRRRAGAILGRETAALLKAALPPRAKGWRTLSVVGRRESPAEVIGDALNRAMPMGGGSSEPWSENRILVALSEIAVRNPGTQGGLLVLIDEMGKFLEAAARDGSDIHLLQQMAELASRSGGRLLVVGILHQAFEEYAHRLSREMRSEWSKIQGRFVDLALNVGGEEQIDLIGRAIENGRRCGRPGRLATGVARLVRNRTSPRLAAMLDECWPLHPVSACLLGPVSRRRFGQNQRSIFGFLSSAEPQGFQNFLRESGEEELYGPDRLWDYLRINLEPSILASPDSHRWATAVDALGRCEAMDGGKLASRLVKSIAIMDLLRDRSGLPASVDLLKLAMWEHEASEVTATLRALQGYSLIIFRKYANAYAIYEGSDFDIDTAATRALEGIGEVSIAALDELAGLRPVVAKRHYHETGALRWFDMSIVPVGQLVEEARAYKPRQGAMGCIFLAVPQDGVLDETARRACEMAISGSNEHEIVVGLSWRAGEILTVVGELLALERVRAETPELQGDRIARIEIRSRIATLQSRLEDELESTLDRVLWFHSGKRACPQPLVRAELNSLASDLADARFAGAPRIHNELLCRAKPSSSAVAARNILLRRMVLHEKENRLGIEGFPAEGGLYASLLKATGLHCEAASGWRFTAPNPDSDVGDPCNLAPAWRMAEELLKINAARAVPLVEIYEAWIRPPIGMKGGVLAVLAVAFFLSKRGSLAFYRQGMFQAHVSDVDIEVLSGSPSNIQLRWMDLSEESRLILSEMVGVVRELDRENELNQLEPIDVARGLVAIYDRLPPWTGRTQRLSSDAKKIRRLFKAAKDPNKLIFDDIPTVLTPKRGNGDVARLIACRIRDGLQELQSAYPSMLERMKQTLLSELYVPNDSSAMLAELRARATNIKGVAGDHRLESFIVRLAEFEGHDDHMEGLAGMAINRPPRDWVDSDIDRATVAIAEMARRFLRMETLAHVKGRQDKRRVMTVIVGLESRATPLLAEFDIGDLDRRQVQSLMKRVESALAAAGQVRREIALAALANLSARYMNATEGTDDQTDGGIVS